MFQILYYLVHALQPILVPLCFLSAWMLMISVAWSIWSMLADSFAKAQQMHTIPCANCRYFTGDYRLKCTVQPYIALSEAAIDCPDHQPLPGFSINSPERA